MPAYLIIKKRLWPALAGLLFCLVLAGPALAADFVWTGGGAGSSWSDPDNWDDPPNIPGAGDTVTINASTAVDLSGDREVDSLTIIGGIEFTGGSIQTRVLDTRGGVIDLNNYSLDVTGTWSASSGVLLQYGTFSIQGNNTLIASNFYIGKSAILHLYGDQTVPINGHTDIDSQIVLHGAGTELTLDIQSGNPYFYTSITGEGSLRIDANNGTLEFHRASSYSGSTTVASGDVVIVGDNSLPTTTTLSVASGAYCFLSNQTLTAITGSGRISSYDLTLSGGTGTFSGTLDARYLNVTGGADITLSGTTNVTYNIMLDSGTLTMSGTTVTGADIINNGGTLNLSGQATIGQYIELNSGTLTLNGTTVTGADIINNGGTLTLNGTINQGITQNSGTLLGTGTCAGLINITGGAFEPGGSIGTFNAPGGLTMAGGTTLAIEVNGARADQVNVSGAVTLNNPTLNLSGTPTAGASSTIINNVGAAAVTGTFAGLPEGQTFTSGGYTYEITYAGVGGNDVVLTALTGGGGGGNPDLEPEPEPEPEPDPAPGAPTGTSPSPTTSLNGPSLSWPKVSGASSYRVFRAACPTCAKEEIGRVRDTSFVDQSALPGQVYYYFVRGEGSGGFSDYSDWMAAWRYEQNPGRAGDFNGDGIADLLWWEPDTNELKIWLMNGGAVQSVVSPGAGQDISQWLLINTGDFNNDGVCDIMWWNPEAGAVEVWYLSGTQGAASGADGDGFQATSSPGSVLGNSTLSYTGDVNGDGRADILWRNYETGEVTLWIMGADGQPQLNGPPTLAAGVADSGRPGVSGSLEWGVRTLHDLDGDGKDDVVWQHAASGGVVVWRMDGAQAIGFAVFQQDGNWRLAGMGDLDGDGKADFIWSDSDSGAIRAWLMRGVFTDELVIVQASAEAAQWQVKAVGDFCSPGCDDVYCKHSETGAVRILKLDGQSFAPSVE